MMTLCPGESDTIAAIATSLGPAGINVIRISGPRSLAIADQIFHSPRGHRPSAMKSFSLRHGFIVSPSLRQSGRDHEVVDEVLIAVMKAPRSYTCEDVVEINCHGGPAAAKTVLYLVLNQGARLAEPGEFTKRAFLNGRIDLTQAEAVADMVSSRTEAFLRTSARLLRGELSQKINQVREDLMVAFAEIEAVLNFPEDDIPSSGRRDLAGRLEKAAACMEEMLARSDQGRIMKEGIQVVLCGRPNVGKSSLLNVFLRENRAIVSVVEGTTRDTIEETAQIEGIPVRFVDTAGILEPRDPVEVEAVARSREAMAHADLICLVFDGSEALTENDYPLIREIEPKRVLGVINKVDCPRVLTRDELKKILPGCPVFEVSAKTREGIADLEREILSTVLGGRTVPYEGLLISNARQQESLRQALEECRAACEELSKETVLEIVSERIKTSINALDRLTGRSLDTDLVDQIFSAFCIGK